MPSRCYTTVCSCMKSNKVVCSLSQFSLNISYLYPLGVPQGSILVTLLFIVYITDMSSYIPHIQFLKFADDTKCFLHISTLSDYSSLQENVTALLTWSRHSDLDFNLKKFVHLSFKCKLDTTQLYYIWHTHTCHTVILKKDFGLILSQDLYWNKHYKTITACAYKVLRLICCTILSCHSSSTIVRLCISLVRS